MAKRNLNATLNFHIAAYSYLSEYLRLDKPFIDKFCSRNASDEEVCKALARLATEYLVIRNFKRQNWEHPRLVSAVRELRKVRRPSSTRAVPQLVSAFAEELKAFYGQYVISAASKFL